MVRSAPGGGSSFGDDRRVAGTVAAPVDVNHVRTNQTRRRRRRRHDGQRIAQAFAQSGFDVSLVDAAQAALDRARSTIDKSLTKLVEKGKLAPANATAALARLSTSPRRSTTLAGADFVVEAIYEDLEAKRTLFGTLDRITRPA